jgi:hypothetical protein
MMPSAKLVINLLYSLALFLVLNFTARLAQAAQDLGPAKTYFKIQKIKVEGTKKS